MRKLLFIGLLALLAFSANAAEKLDPTLRTLTDLTIRLTSLEEENRRLHGRIEDMEYKLQQMEKKQTTIPATPTNVIKAPENPYQTFVTNPAPDEMDELVNTLPENDIPVEGEALFNKAYNQLGKLQYDEAEKSFQSFIVKHPKSPLVANAYYWLGEIDFSNDNYAGAAVNYLKSYKVGPKNENAAEAVLKTATSLKALGKKPEACKNYQRFFAEFPNAHATLKSTARTEMKSIGCK